jgi:hypothetical protein
MVASMPIPAIPAVPAIATMSATGPAPGENDHGHDKRHGRQNEHESDLHVLNACSSAPTPQAIPLFEFHRQLRAFRNFSFQRWNKPNSARRANSAA